MEAKEPSSQVAIRDCEKVSPNVATTFQNELAFFSDINSQHNPKLESEEGRHSVWEAETDSSEGSDLCEHEAGTGEDFRDEVEFVRDDSFAEEAQGAKWEFFDLDSDHIISEDVLPTILEDETLQMPLLTARDAARSSSWGISEALHTSFEVLSGVAVGFGSMAGSAALGALEATHAFLSCSAAFDAFLELHMEEEEKEEEEASRSLSDGEEA